MILFRDKSVGYSSYGLIKHLTIWSEEFNRQGGILFYPKNPQDVVEITAGDREGDFEIFMGTHNKKGITEYCTTIEKTLYDLLQSLISKNKERKTFIINLDELSEVTKQDFISYSPQTAYPHNLFIFDLTSDEGGFPKIYSINSPDPKGTHKYTLNAMAFSSHNSIKCAGIPTLFGKNLLYILTASKISGKFTGDDFPILNSIYFGTSKREDIPSFLDTKNLESFVEKSGAKNLKNVGGSIEDVEEIDSLVPDTLLVENLDNVTLRIQKTVLNQNMIYLSDLICIGAEKTIECVPIKDIIIPIMVDFGTGIRKMCLKEGKIYVLTWSKDYDWRNFLGEDSDLLINCSEEDFPSNIL